MVTRIDPRSLNNAEAVHFNDRIGKRFTPIPDLPTALQAALGHFTETNEEMNELVQRAKGSSFSDAVQAADALRDRYVHSFFNLCEGYVLCENEERVKAATLLLTVLEPYGTASQLAASNHDSETKLVANLVRDLRARPERVAALELLGLSSLVAALEAANQQFISSQENRTDEESGKPEAYRMVTLRRTSAKAYTALMKLVESAYLYNGGAEPWATLVSGINAIAQETKTKLAQRAAHAAPETSTPQP